MPISNSGVDYHIFRQLQTSLQAVTSASNLGYIHIGAYTTKRFCVRSQTSPKYSNVFKQAYAARASSLSKQVGLYKNKFQIIRHNMKNVSLDD